MLILKKMVMLVVVDVVIVITAIAVTVKSALKLCWQLIPEILKTNFRMFSFV